MELASQLIGNTETIMESKLNKISMEFRGDKARIDFLINNLQILSNQIKDGTSPDLDGLFRYEKSFLDQVFKPQIQIKVLHQILKLFNYESKLNDEINLIISNAKFEEILNLHKEYFQALHNTLNNQNRDIQKFLSSLFIKYKINQEEIAKLANNIEILGMKDDSYYFKIDSNSAYDIMKEYLDDMGKQKESMTLPDKDDFSINEIFEGGKMVFMKNGKELNDIIYKRDELSENNYNKGSE